MTKTVLILGASGKIGVHSARAFAKAGWTVRKYTRGTDMTAAAMGVDVIVNGMNPPNYHDWATIIPAITREVIAAAKASGATVLIPGNVYNYGQEPAPWSEATPQRPCTRKGEIRKTMESAYRSSGVQTVILRAGTFIDPDRNGDVLDTVQLKSAHRGKVTALGRHDAQHAWTYVPDWARAAVMLAETRDSLALFVDIPMPHFAMSIGELAERLGQMTGRDLKVVDFPWWVMRLAAPFWELARELLEMRYLFNHDHAMGGGELARLLPDFQPTPTEVVIQQLVHLYIDPNEPMRAAIA